MVSNAKLALWLPPTLYLPARWIVFRLRLNIIPEIAMTETVLAIKHWGNNLGVRLPAAVASAAHLHADQRVRITVEGERIIITPLHNEPLSLEQRLARFDPERHGGEAMSVDERLGAERW
jgi:antitoxin MazE